MSIVFRLVEPLACDPFDPAEPLAFASLIPWLDIATLRHARAGLRLFSN